MIPSWYDVLDVDPDASTDEIRAAWKSSVAGLDPTDRRFKQRNRAAEVLLAPERRAAHDADLAAQGEDAEESDESDGPAAADVDTARTPATKSTVTAPAKGSTTTSGTAKPKATDRAKAPTLTKPIPSSPQAPADDTNKRWRRIAIATGVLATALLVAAILALTGGGSSGAAGRAGNTGLPDTREVAAARAAAEAAIGPVLSFDYRDLEASQAAAVSFMTTEYAETYTQNFAGFVEENAPTTRTIVTAEVVTSGVVRTGVDRVDVLLFVNRPTRNSAGDKVSRDQVTVQMRDVDGRWLVDCLVTAPGSSCDA